MQYKFLAPTFPEIRMGSKKLNSRSRDPFMTLKGIRKGHVTYFWYSGTLHIGNGWARNFKFVMQIEQ